MPNGKAVEKMEKGKLSTEVKFLNNYRLFVSILGLRMEKKEPILKN